MAGRSFTRHSNGIGNRIRAEHINELQAALEEDDARIDLKTDDGQFTAHVDDTDNPHGVTKAQVGLGNVDNTSDADKPISTAQQAALDGKADVEDGVPEGGVYGQVLTVTHSGKAWADPPGIVYPSLLLSPDGSFDRNGPVAPTIVGDVSVVQGQYGPAWKNNGGSGSRVRVTRPRFLFSDAGTVVFRVRFETDSTGVVTAILAGPNLQFARVSGHRPYWILRSGYDTGVYGPSIGGTGPVMGALTWRLGAARLFVNGSLINTATVSSNSLSDPINIDLAQSLGTIVEGFLQYPDAIPDAEVQRLADMPAAWTMQNTAVNMALQSQPPATPSGASITNYFPPNRKVAAGGTTLRTAPGTTGVPTITTLAAGTDVHSTGQTVTASSVSYTYIATPFGFGYVPTSTLI